MLKDLLRNASKKTIESYSVKPEKMSMDMPVAESKKEHYPSIHLSNKILPEIEEWKDGEDYVIVLKVTQVGSSSYSHGGKKSISADFEVKEAAYVESRQADDNKKEKIKKLYS